MDFRITDEQKNYVENLRKFINTTINKEDMSFYDKWKACAEYGIFGIPYNEQYNGLGEDFLTAALIMEELGYSCTDSGFSFAITNHMWACLNSIYRLGNELQKREYIPYMISGDKIGALALTSAEKGSDVMNVGVKASKVNGGYLLCGSKTYISNGPIADIIVVSARTGSVGSLNSISCFICEVEKDGIKKGESIEKMGLNNCPMSEIFFDNVFIPEHRILGNIGNGIQTINKIMQWERVYEFAVQIGIMKKLMEKSIVYCNNRGLNEYQAITHKIAKMKIGIELSELLMYKIACLDTEKQDIYLESSIFKYFVSEEYTKLCLDVLQIFGAYGYTVESGIEQMVRDALSSTIYAGTSEVQLNIIYKLTQNKLFLREK